MNGVVLEETFTIIHNGAYQAALTGSSRPVCRPANRHGQLAHGQLAHGQLAHGQLALVFMPNIDHNKAPILV